MSKSCFVVMPFRPELNYFYLYLQQHLRKKHSLQAERGDNQVSTAPLIEKIRRQIRQADMIIGDISGDNANVFYELGLADGYGKPIILITQDPADKVATDVKHLDIIHYQLSKHVEFLDRL